MLFITMPFSVVCSPKGSLLHCLFVVTNGLFPICIYFVGCVMNKNSKHSFYFRMCR